MAADPAIKPLQKYDRDQSGSTVIPPSLRPDGSVRKAIRVKDGFVPQDEIPAFKTRQVVQFTMPKAAVPVGFDPVVKDDEKKEPSKSAIKRARQKAKKAQDASVSEAADKMNKLSVSKGS